MSLTESSISESRLQCVGTEVIDDLTAASYVTEFSIAADGRLYIFGAAHAPLEVLRACGWGRRELVQRIARIRTQSAAAKTAEVRSRSRRRAHE